MRTILFLVLACILSVAVSVHAANQCTAISTPQGKLTFGTPANFAGFFSSLRQTGVAEGSYPFYFSLCDPSLIIEGGKACTPPSFISQGSGTSAGCNVVFPTMIANTPVWNPANSKVQFNYTSTSNQLSWQANINCACDKTATNMKVPSANYVAAQAPSGLITLDFEITSAGCCPDPNSDSDGPAGGITWGGVFLIIFFVPLGLYFFIFLAINFKNEKRGKDLLPHPEFWGSLPGLAKDGITFIFAKIRGQPWTPSEGGSSSAPAGEAAGNYTPV